MDFEGYLSVLCSSLPPGEAVGAIEILIKIVQNAIEHPKNEHYRRLHTGNKTFNQRVWRHPQAQDIMLAIGWVEVEGDVVLPSDDHLEEAFGQLTKTRSSLRHQHPALASPLQSRHRHPEGDRTSRSPELGSSPPGSPNLYQERIKRMKENQRKVEEERRRIAEQIKHDREETSHREARPSHSAHLFGPGHMTTYKDVGMDLNKGGG